MTQKQTKKTSRNLLVFEAPIELTEKAKWMAAETMVSTSAICRQAVSQYINRYEADERATGYASY